MARSRWFLGSVVEVFTAIVCDVLVGDGEYFCYSNR